MTARPIKHKDWIAEACTLFGNDMVHWVFVCPVCEHEASCGDFAKVHGPVPLVNLRNRDVRWIMPRP